MPRSKSSGLTLIVSLMAVMTTGMLLSTGQSAPGTPDNLSVLAIPRDLQALEIIQIPVDALAVEATFDTPIAEVEIPAYAQRLSGRMVRLRGMMLMPFKENGLTEWVLIPETKARSIFCGSSNVPLHACIHVMTPAGHSEELVLQPITVEGTFEVRILADDEGVYQIYRLTNAKIVEKGSRLRGNPVVFLFGC